jgi:uncharacterized protein YcfL
MKSNSRLFVIAALLVTLAGCEKKTQPSVSEQQPLALEQASTDQAQLAAEEVSTNHAPLAESPSEATRQTEKRGQQAAEAGFPPAPGSQGAPNTQAASASQEIPATAPNSLAETAPRDAATTPNAMNPDSVILEMDNLIEKLASEAGKLSGKKREQAEQRLQFLRQRREEEKQELSGVTPQ